MTYPTKPLLNMRYAATELADKALLAFYMPENEYHQQSVANAVERLEQAITAYHDTNRESE